LRSFFLVLFLEEGAASLPLSLSNTHQTTTITTQSFSFFLKNPSLSYLDDLAWAAAWMGRATGDPWFTQRARFYWSRAGAEHPGLASALQNLWSDALAGAAVLLAADTGGPEYSAYLWRFCEAHLQGSWPVSFTPAGLSYRHQWGSLRVSTGAATVVAAFGALLSATDPVTARKYACFARGQVRYALGDTGRSFVVGYGANPPVRPHHRAASCPAFEPGTAGQDRPHCDGRAAFNNPGPNPNVLTGALVGGPSAGDAYEDRRDDYVRNEVALDYQTSFVGALSAVVAADAAQHGGETWGACLSSFAGSLRPIKRVV
jgi:endoglucanase